MTDKRKELLNLARQGQFTKKQAVEIVGGSYYCNASFHVGNILSRMVKAGMLRRVKNGVFELNITQEQKLLL